MEIVLEDKLKRRYVFGDTEIYCGKDIIENIPPTLKKVFEDGAVCVVHDGNLSECAQQVCSALKHNGYRVFAVDERNSTGASETQPPEYVRYIFAIGAGKAAAYAKQIAREYGVGWSMLFTAPSTDTIISGYAPKQVFIDENIMVKCPNECIAAGWGIVLTEPLRAFERYFAHKVLNDGKGVEVGKQKELAQGADVVSLAVKLLEISYLKRGTDTAEVMAHLLSAYAEHKGNKPRLVGEYKFVAGALLCAFYSAYLGAPSIDVMPPVCHEEIIDRVQSFVPASANTRKSIDFFDINSYFRISYILGEYRLDLLDKLSGIDMHTTQRFWRRLYPDAGYWLKSTLNADMMLNALALAGELSDGLLGFASASGFTAGYLLKNSAKKSA